MEGISQLAREKSHSQKQAKNCWTFQRFFGVILYKFLTTFDVFVTGMLLSENEFGMKKVLQQNKSGAYKQKRRD